jgi:hypothetical protein
MDASGDSNCICLTAAFFPYTCFRGTFDHGWVHPAPIMQAMWAPTVNTVRPVPGMGGHFSGGDPQMQQQAQSQALILFLQQHSEQLATQAASHTHQF